MNKSEKLREYNRWRRGDETIMPPHPTELGLLIDEAADELEKLRGLVAELMDTELGELACAGSHAPVEDILGRMQAALNAR